MAFLSDQLLEIGMKSNPKSNMSMGEAAKKMLSVLQNEKDNGMSMRKLQYIVSLACKQLRDTGRNFFKPDIFFSQV